MRGWGRVGERQSWRGEEEGTVIWRSPCNLQERRKERPERWPFCEFPGP